MFSVSFACIQLSEVIMKLILTILIFATLAFDLSAQTQIPVKFDGQIRARNEADARDFNSDTEVNTYSLLRTRFGAAIQPTSDVNVYIQIQDSRAFGSEPSTLANTANVDIHQAFFQVNDLWGYPLTLKIGRQEMVYGNQRLIGAVGWSNVGRSFDAAKLSIGKKNTLDLFSAIINENNTPVTGAATPAAVEGEENTDFNFVGAYYKHRNNPDYMLDIYGLFESNLNESIPDENDLNRLTLGSYNKGKFGNSFDFETEVALQLGKRMGQDVSAFMLTGALGYTFQTAKAPSVSIGIDYLSGSEAGDEDYNTFDTIFATNHKFYGYMDYFINIPDNTNDAGLVDIMAKVNYPLSNSLKFNAHFHNFQTAKGDEKNLGNELDLILDYQYNKVASFQFGVSAFVPGDLTEQIFGGNDDIGFWSHTTFLVTF